MTLIRKKKNTRAKRGMAGCVRREEGLSEVKDERNQLIPRWRMSKDSDRSISFSFLSLATNILVMLSVNFSRQLFTFEWDYFMGSLIDMFPLAYRRHRLCYRSCKHM